MNRVSLPDIGGYVLAGGQSSRMGRDKAEVTLAGKPLLEHAVTKLRRMCTEVHVLGNRPALARYAPLVADVHAGCGPLGGMEAALLHTRFAWNLFLPVDVPFLPTAFLAAWVQESFPVAAARGVRVLMFRVQGRPQPTLALVHSEVRPFLTEALEYGTFKLLPALAQAARSLAIRDGLPPEAGLEMLHVEQGTPCPAGDIREGDDSLSVGPEPPNVARWFANLNTPEDLQEAERQAAWLDT